MSSAFDSIAFDPVGFDSFTLYPTPRYKFTNQTTFPAKRPVDEVIFSVDFSSLLSRSAGEEISSARWYITTVGNVDRDANSMISGQHVILGNIVMQMIKGGKEGMRYVAYCAVQTTFGQTLTLPPIGKGVFKVSEISE